MVRDFRDDNTTEEPVHNFFGLTYAAYHVVPRSILQSMPLDWQQRWVMLTQELEQTLAAAKIVDLPVGYRVTSIDESNRFTKDPYAQYERGRRRIDLRKSE